MRDTVYCVLCVLITLMVGVLAARYVADFWMLAFFESLQIHLALACVAGAILALFVRRHWYAVLLLVLGLLLAGHGVVMLREGAVQAAPADAAPSFKLLSFNIDDSNTDNSKRIADLIIGSNADVVEIFEAEPLLPELSRISQAYPYRVGCGVLIATEDCDSLLLSKRPLISPYMHDLSALWQKRFIMAKIDMDGQMVAFATAHLSKPYFDGFHGVELDDIAEQMRSVREPLLLAGDFNAAVIAPDMLAFLKDNGLGHVFPEPSTWPISAGPLGISIDHVFARPPLKLKSVKRIEDAMGSNHYGLMTEFTVGK